MRILFAGLAVLALAGCTTETNVEETVTTKPSIDALAIVDAGNKAFREAFQAKDAAALAALYTADGMLIPPDAPDATGREEIAAYWSNVFGVVHDAVITTLEAEAPNDETIIERSRVTLFDADGTQIGSVKAMIVWKKEDGAWKLDRDIWNTGP